MFRLSRWSTLALSLAISLGAHHASAEVRLPAVIGSDMVLQQGANLPIWGWAESGETITVNIAGQNAKCKAGLDGRWRVTLGKLAATPDDKPLEMVIKGDSGDEITLKRYSWSAKSGFAPVRRTW